MANTLDRKISQKLTCVYGSQLKNLQTDEKWIPFHPLRKNHIESAMAEKKLTRSCWFTTLILSSKRNYVASTVM